LTGLAQINPLDAQNLTVCNVIILDDSALDRSRIEQELSQLPFDCRIQQAESIAEFRQQVNSASFDLALVDYMLGNEIGTEALAICRSSPKNQTTLMVMVSGAEMAQLPIGAVQAGFHEFLSKSEYLSDMLMGLLMEAMQRKMQRQSLGPSVETGGVSSPGARFEGVAPTPAENADLSTIAAQGSNNGPKVLIASPDASRNRELGFMLQACAPDICKLSADTVETAFDMLEATAFDALVLDIDALSLAGRLSQLAGLVQSGLHLMLVADQVPDCAGQLVDTAVPPRVMIRDHLNTPCLRLTCAGLLHDIRQKQSADDREDAAERFVGNVIHDLKAPMRHIRQVADMVEETALTGSKDELQDALALQRTIATRATSLIDALAEYHASGGATLDSSVALAGIVDAAQQQAASARPELVVEMEREKLPTLLGDEPMLTRLMTELFTNAALYTAAPTPMVRISWGQLSSGHFSLRIDDNGIGIEDQYRDLVLEPMKRLWSADDYPGSGLGLTICKRIMDRHGGRIALEPGEGGGTRVVLTFPAERVREDSPDNDPEAGRAKNIPSARQGG